jgi:alkylation response protein AidB-like acyl-CoA dehydrogenase
VSWTPSARLAHIEAALDEASRPGGVLCPDTLLSLDDQEAFPSAAAAYLDELEVYRFYIDRDNGGELDDLFELTHLVRLLARRDLTLAVGHAKTFLGAASVWLVGDDVQRRSLSERIRRGAIVSWGLTERGHGGDLLSDELTASAADEGWLLTGEKWLINNATRGDLTTVLARTSAAGGPRGFSLMLFDKDRTDARTWAPTPKVPTHGIRGADISGIAFRQTPLDADAMIGPLGSGAETTLKTLQLTRTMCCGLSLGALDHALVLGRDFLRERHLYGTTLADVPHVQQELGRCLAALHTAEAVCFATARAAGNTPDELSLISATAKALVPEVCQGAISALGELLGVRGYLSEAEPYRGFQKIDRDHRIVSIFDGSTAVCRNLEIDHFPLLARSGLTSAGRSGLLDQPSRPWDPSRMRLLARSCSLVSAMAEDCEAIAAQADAGDDDVPVTAASLALVALSSLKHVLAQMADVDRGPRQIPQSAFDLARDFELCFAAAAVCRVWVDAAGRTGKDPGLWTDGLWLTASLLLIVEKLPVRDSIDAAWHDVFGTLGRLALDDAGRDTLSLFGSGDAQ